MRAVRKLTASPTRAREEARWYSGDRIVAGVDEAGRGALAGPVVAAAVVLRPDFCPEGVDDSKKLTPERRTYLFSEILASALFVGVYCVGPRRIDEINILRASELAMRKAIAALGGTPDAALVDGLPVPGFPCPSEAIIGGDGLECSIAAASIIAKVTRDMLMVRYHFPYPNYGFPRHKGYGTAQHRQAIQQFGMTPIHRRTFIHSAVETLDLEY